MTSVMALDGVTSFLRLKEVKNACIVNVSEIVRSLAGFLQCNGGKLEEAEYFKSVFIIYCEFESK